MATAEIATKLLEHKPQKICTEKGLAAQLKWEIACLASVRP
jgi:hypothetical protein